nr:MAG TPA: hypothetical protein [Caudoviricetes sp.]
MIILSRETLDKPQRLNLGYRIRKLKQKYRGAMWK